MVRATSPAAIVVFAPYGEVRETGISDIVDASAWAFARETDLDLGTAGVDRDALAACPAATRIRCWTERAPSELAYLVVASIAMTDDSEVVSATLLDLEGARTAIAAGEPEAALLGFAIDLPPRPIVDTRAFFVDAITTAWRASLERQGHFRPYGRVVLRVDCPQCVLEVDGVTRVLSNHGRHELAGVRIGRRKLLLRQRLQTCVVETDVVRTTVVEVDATTTCAVSLGPAPTDTAIWVGAGAALTGVVALAWSAAIAWGPSTSACLSKQTGTCDHVGLPRSGFGGVDGFRPVDDADRGLPVFAFGAGLVAGGGSIVVMNLLDADTPWWLSTVVGVVTAGAVTSVTHLIGSR